jgi:transcriptional regulator with GAF, ATPase, and Fis domain
VTASSVTRAFVDATAAMVQDRDVADTLAKLLHDCATSTAANAVGLLVTDERGDLDVLSATSHQATELELYQLQLDVGPCIDAVRTGASVAAAADSDIKGRWGVVGEAILEAGFHAVQSVPLRWHGRIIGALNAFHRDPGTIDEDTEVLLQAFADVATVVIVQSAELSSADLAERIRRALAGRTVIEQAKGVLAQTAQVDMAAAYELLARRAAESGSSLSETAARIIQDAQTR